MMLLFVVVALLSINEMEGKSEEFKRKFGEHHAQPWKRDNDNAFANDINKCLFTKWTTASGSKDAVLSGPVQCKGQGGTAVQLCYGTAPPVAQFAVCYNTNTLIPDFTGHIVRKDIEGVGRDTDWRADVGTFAPKPQSTIADYDPYSQKGLYDNYDIQNQYFCAKGHLTPNADFTEDDQRYLTMITTNIAPQWQNFNSKNWAGLEEAVRTSARNDKRDVYVFTGVGGQARNLMGDIIKLNKRVLAPRWYWKAVCDPGAKQSIVFLGENAIGIADTTKAAGCNNIMQTKNAGIVYCYSLEGARKKYPDFKWPPFNENCKPSEKGTFMDNELRNAFV